MTAYPLAETTDGLPLDQLRDIVGAENVITDAGELSFYSTDVYRRADVDAILVLRPRTVEELSTAVATCASHGLAIVPRGGGLSYTGGFLPTAARTAMIDMTLLDGIVEINEEDMYVVVEAGCSWRKLYEVLQQRGLRTPYFGPMSGYASTVGGALSQGSIFLGSTQYGSTAETTLGLDVVLADGSIVATGSSGSRYSTNAFFRAYGPDLTGLFLNDAGALGVKARAALRLIRSPEHTGFLTFTFGGYADLLAAMSEISRQGLAAECFGADPYIWGMRLWDSDLAKDLKRLGGVVKANRSFVGGLRDAVRIAASGRRALSDVEFALNVIIDGRSGADVDEAMLRVRAIAAAGREVEASAPKALRGTPFLPPDDLLGPSGKRWAPIHGIAPHSRVVEVVDRIHRLFEERAPLFERLGIEWGYVVFAISTTAILVEPMIYWPGARDPYHERMISPAALAKLPKGAHDAEAATAVQQLREALTQMWMEMGCAHFQIGKTYRYLESRTPAVTTMLNGLKDLVDPERRMNPGALGLR